MPEVTEILTDFPEEVVAKVKELEGEAVALFTPPFKVSEVFAFIETLGEIVGQAENATKENVKETLDQLWKYYNEKFEITKKLDDLIKLPVYLEPFDEKAIELLIGWAIPAAVGALPIPDNAEG